MRHFLGVALVLVVGSILISEARPQWGRGEQDGLDPDRQEVGVYSGRRRGDYEATYGRRQQRPVKRRQKEPSYGQEYEPEDNYYSQRRRPSSRRRPVYESSSSSRGGTGWGRGGSRRRRPVTTTPRPYVEEEEEETGIDGGNYLYYVGHPQMASGCPEGQVQDIYGYCRDIFHEERRDWDWWENIRNFRFGGYNSGYQSSY